MMATKPRLSYIKDTLRNMQEEKVITKLECFLRNISRTCNIKQESYKQIETNYAFEDKFVKSEKGIEESENVSQAEIREFTHKKKQHYKTGETIIKTPLQYTQEGHSSEPSIEKLNCNDISKCLTSNSNKQCQYIKKYSADSQSVSLIEKNTNPTLKSEGAKKNKRRKIDTEKFNHNSIAKQSNKSYLKISETNQKSNVDSNNAIDTLMTTRNALQSSSGSLIYVQTERSDEHINCRTPLMAKTNGSNGRDSLPEHYEKYKHRKNKPGDSQHTIRIEDKTDASYEFKKSPDCTKRNNKTKTFHQNIQYAVKPPKKVKGNHQESNIDSDNTSNIPITNLNVDKSSSESYVSVISGRRNEQSLLNAYTQFENSGPLLQQNYNGHYHSRRKSKDSHIVDMTERSAISSFEYEESSDNIRRKTRTKEANQDNPTEHHLCSPIRKEEIYQMSNLDSDNANTRLIPCKGEPSTSTRSFSSVLSNGRNEQINPCNSLKTEIGKTKRKAKKSQRDDSVRLKRSTDSSSEYETDFTQRKLGSFQREQCVSRKSFKSRSHMKFAVRPKICEQHLPRGDSTHSSALYLMKKLMQAGEAMLEKDYIYFMFHTVKQIMECTKESEEKILAMTCKDFENCHEIVSKCGRIIYILDTDDGFLPPLGVEEWECLKLFKQQRDIVCRKKISENTKFVESIYVFIGFDGQSIREETKDIDDENELSMGQSENNGPSQEQPQSAVVTADTCTDLKEGLSLQSS